MDIYQLILTFRYVAIFIGTFIEGPTVGLIVGFLSRIGYINLYLGYLSHVLGDVSADLLYYAIGYFGGTRVIPKVAKLLRYSVDDIEKLENSFKKHSSKFIIIGKLTHVIAFPVMIVAGLARYSWYKFLVFDIVATLIKGVILVFLGYHFGSLWGRVDNVIILISAMALLAVLAQGAYFISRRVVKIKNGSIAFDGDEEEKKWRKKWKK